MRVLSIDFDYFQNVSEKVLLCYPDGIDNNTTMSEIAWGGRYANPRNEIDKVGIMKKEFDAIKRKLRTIDPACPIMIAGSHKHIYDFICGLCDENETLSVVNVDMHHDFTNDSPELDCGNWLSYLAERQKNGGGKFRFTWVANPVSASMYDLDDPDEPDLNLLKSLMLTSLSEIKGRSFDAIFLCRSDTWSPPHLDKYFTELCDLMREHFKNGVIEKDIDKPRTMYLEIMEGMRQAFKKHNFANFNKENRQ